MSLFPAYAAAAAASESSSTTQQQSSEGWLNNSSFQIDVQPQQSDDVGKEQSTAKEDEVIEKKKRKKPGKNHQRNRRRANRDRKRALQQLTKCQPQYKNEGIVFDFNDDFTIDKTRSINFLSMNKLQPPIAPRYFVNNHLSYNRQQNRRHIFKRYYRIRIVDKSSEKGDDGDSVKLTKGNLHEAAFGERDCYYTGLKQEEELSRTTATYNKRLAEQPDDVKTWLEYVNFQNMVYEFEKSYKKGSIVKGQRVLAERKLAILDKALGHNHNCEALLRERLNIAVSAFPADELQTQLKQLVEKERGNLILWQGYIEVSQCSMSHCNTPAVLALYTKCLSTLHQLRRNATLEKAQLEENILRMLYQCGLFLKQAGLFEQLWTMLRMYLELNLSQPFDKKLFNLSSGFNETQLVELEEVVFTSALPLHELWLRTEKLREACHWLPYSGDAPCEDPQRLVFTDDVAELIHPITMQENVFKLTATVLTLLKVPLLPCRHSTMQQLGLDYVPWALDSIEPLLPVFFPMFPVDLTNEHLLDDSRLAVGPQYLKVLPGQMEYLEFILTIMRNCADCLQGDDRTAVMIWWFRFQRLLIVLDKLGRFKMPVQLKKSIRSSIKGLLKLDEHRNNALFYSEFALIELELGNVDSCISIITAALQINENRVISAHDWSQSQAIQCYLYRQLFEVSLRVGSQPPVECLKYIMDFVLQKHGSLSDLSETNLQFTEQKLKLITLQLLEHHMEKQLDAVQHFQPDFPTDWFILHGWFVYLTKGAIQCGVFVERTLEKMDEGKDAWQREVLYEFYVAVLFKHCMANPGSGVFKILDEVLYRAIALYPNNLFLLAVLAKEQSRTMLGQPFWKLKELLLKTGRAYSTLFAVIIPAVKIAQLEDTLIDTVTGEKFTVDGSFKNQMLSLFRRITQPDMCTRRCGLVWRLYLQFVHTYFGPTLCRNVYYSAVEECPWVKTLYIDAAIYIPAELPQIQDLIIEKQLRLHVLPEELDVLRS